MWDNDDWLWEDESSLDDWPQWANSQPISKPFTIPQFEFGQIALDSGLRLPQFQFGEITQAAEGLFLPKFSFGEIALDAGIRLPGFQFGEISLDAGIRLPGFQFGEAVGPPPPPEEPVFRLGAEWEWTVEEDDWTEWALVSQYKGRPFQLPQFQFGEDASQSIISGSLTLLEAQVTAVAGFGVTIDAALPLLEAAIAASSGYDVKIDAELPLLEGEVIAGAHSIDGVLPLMEADVQVFAGPLVTIDGALPRLEGQITAQTGVIAVIDALLPTLEGAIAVSTAAVATIQGTLPQIAGEITAVAGVAAAIDARLPLLESSIQAYGPFTATIDGVLPLLQVYATVTTQTVAGTVVAVMNLANHGVTEYTNFPFESFCEFDGKLLAAGAGGIYLLGGDLDEAAQIAAEITTGVTDFGSEYNKRLTDAYVSAESSGKIDFSVLPDGGEKAYTEKVPTAANKRYKQHKVSLAKGVKARYFQIRVANKAGADMRIGMIDIEAQILSRRN